MDTPRIALISGANKGIGYEVAKQLGTRGYSILLGSRKLAAGQAAVRSLQQLGVRATLIELDVSSRASIATAIPNIQSHVQKLDLLVNNAAIYVDGDETIETISHEIVESTVATNLLGPIYLTQALAPLLSKSRGARVINVSSGLGALSSNNGTKAPSYSISKTALNAVTKQFAAAFADRGILVNSVCPGWVRTDMGGPSAHRSVEEGADTIVWLATDIDFNQTGGFYRDRELIDW